MYLLPSPNRVLISTKAISIILIALGWATIARSQNQTTSIAILSFQDDTGANAPADLGNKLAQDLHQKIAVGYKDLFPRLLTGTDATSLKGMSIEQLAAMAKQNGARFIIRGGLLTFTAQPAGSDNSIAVQLYADIISADNATLVTTVRAEGSGTQAGSAPQLSSLDIKSVTFSSSGVGQAFSATIAQLADAIHQAIVSGTSGSATTSSSPQPTPAQPDTSQSAAAQTANSDTDLQQLITQAESLIASSANPSSQSMTAVSQALEALKTSLASKATLMQSGQDTSTADQSIATQKQALQNAVSQVTAEASSAGSGTAPVGTPTGTKKSFMDQISGFAGQALNLLQQIQQIRTTLQSFGESSANGGQSGGIPTSGGGGSGNPTDQALGEVTGIVTDQNSTPIPSAQVTEQTSGASTSTDSNGQYDLKGLLANQMATLSVTVNGKTMTAQTPITNGQPATVDFQFQPDQTGGGATGGGGGGGHPIVLPPTVIVNPTRQLGVNGGLVKGFVRDAQGLPVSRALVSLKGLGMARTNSQGAYTFLNVPPGSQQLTVTLPGLSPKTTQVVVTPAKSSQAMIQFANSDRIAVPTRSMLMVSNSGVTLQGTVFDKENHPIPGAKISLIQQTSAVAVFSGPNGRFLVNNVKPGPYRVMASKVGYDSSVKNLQLNAGNNGSIEFRLDQQNSPLVANLLRRQTTLQQTVRPGTIRGHVVTANGDPLASATVTLESSSTSAVVAATRTNQDGEYQLTAPAGQYRVRANRDSYQQTSQVVTVTNGTVKQTDLVLSPERRLDARRTDTIAQPRAVGPIAGQVVEVKTGKPLAGATVTLSGKQAAVTDSQGRFLIVNLSPGNYQLAVSKSGYAAVQGTIRVDSGQTASANLTLTPLAVRSPTLRRLP